MFPLPSWLGRPLGSWLGDRDPRDLALYLACVPLLIGLPAAALVIFALRFVRTPTPALVRQWSTVIVVAILNILVSAYALAWLSELFWAYSLDGVRSFWDLFLPRRAMPGWEEPVPV